MRCKSITVAAGISADRMHLWVVFIGCGECEMRHRRFVMQRRSKNSPKTPVENSPGVVSIGPSPSCRGLALPRRSERNPMLTLEEFINVRELKQQGWRVSAIAARPKVDRRTVRKRPRRFFQPREVRGSRRWVVRIQVLPDPHAVRLSEEWAWTDPDHATLAEVAYTPSGAVKLQAHKGAKRSPNAVRASSGASPRCRDGFENSSPTGGSQTV
jgi:hypothetical protein